MSDSDELVRCVFASATTLPGTDEHVHALLRDYGNKSREREVTGMLMCEGADVLQVLEGRRSSVEALYRTISRDARQHRLIKLHEEPVDKRDFKQMNLAYGVAGRRVFRQLDDNREVFGERGTVSLLPESRSTRLMKQFAKRRWRRGSQV